MTTAHRPTFDPARGKDAARGEAYHQRLLPAHKTLKFRQPTQGGPGEQNKRDLRAELLRAEAEHYAKKEGRKLDGDGTGAAGHLAIAGEPTAAESGTKRSLAEVDGDDGDPDEDYEAKKRRVLEETKHLDADSDSNDESDDDEDSDDDDDDDGDDDLERELIKIRAERAEAAAKEAAEKAKRDEEQREKDIALGNPLLNVDRGPEFGVKRRWDDDVVFKNQARGTEERGKDKRFVNDLLRSDFHRKFMDRYIR